MASSSSKKSDKKTGQKLNRSLGREAMAIFLVFIGVFGLLALASYHHTDPSLFSKTARVPRNIGGRVGADLAEFMIQISGLGSFLIPILFMSFAGRIFQGAQTLKLLLNTIWIGLAFIAGSTLMNIQFGMIHYGGTLIPSGGILGQILGDSLRHYFNLWGATLITLCALLISLVYSTPLSAKALWAGLLTLAKSIVATFVALTGGTAIAADKLWHATRAVAGRLMALLLKRKAQPIAPSSTTIEATPSSITSMASPSIIEMPVDLPDEVNTQPKDLSLSEANPGIIIEDRADNDPALLQEQLKLKEVDSRKESLKKKRSLWRNNQWTLPPLGFLKEPPARAQDTNRNRLVENSRNLEMKLAEFGISGQVVAVRPGPVITMYEFKPGSGVKISSIASRADDLSLALEAQSVRIVAPIPGKSVVGIEIPNDNRETVFLKELLSTKDFQGGEQQIPIAVGKDASGMPIVTDIAAAPHLLVAGSSGAGKSVFINTLITSLLYKFTPHDLRMIMVDPKQLELALYDRIPHLLLPVVDDPHKASTSLRWACTEMERRYTIMARAGVRNLKSFNQKLEIEGEKKLRQQLCPVEADGTPGKSSIAHLLEFDENGEPKIEHLPFIVVVIDEFADLMMVARKEIENHVARLAAKARAAGIHLIIATQRPSTDVITGVIKNNLPSRVGFKVPSQIDSRTILDATGADKLLGKGDMLFVPPGVSRLVRAHGAYVDEEEIERICDFWRAQGEPAYREEILAEPEELTLGDGAIIEGVSDPLYQQAITIVREEGSASASKLQRRLGIGYNRAARIIESMEEQGLVGPALGSKPREVIY
jgi:S-DNA-T family DNA segregation ATPase FtsK/SpoIIIE